MKNLPSLSISWLKCPQKTATTLAVTSKNPNWFHYFVRYPFVAAEIFSCELNSILEKFFEAPDNLDSWPGSIVNEPEKRVDTEEGELEPEVPTIEKSDDEEVILEQTENFQVQVEKVEEIIGETEPT